MGHVDFGKTPKATGLVRDIASGGLSGTMATFAMSALMLGAQRAGFLGEQPPRKLSDALLDDITGGRADESQRRLGTAMIHLGIGATAAGLNQAGRRLVGWPGPAAISGGAFGAFFWAINYGLVAPALGIMPPPDRDRRWRAPVMLAANVIWGASSAVVGDRLTDRVRYSTRP